MAKTLSIISMASFAASVFFLIAAVFFFFFFNIPSVYGDLTGLTAKRALAKRRAANEKSTVVHLYEPSKKNKMRGKTTDSIAPVNKTEGKAEKKGKRKQEVPEKKELVFASLDDRPETGLLNENKAETAKAAINGETELLGGETTSLGFGDGSGTTDFLENTAVPVSAAPRKTREKLTILDEVVLVHTDEVIE